MIVPPYGFGHVASNTSPKSKPTGPMCWLCYKQAENMTVALNEWHDETIQGRCFWECPDCHEPEEEDDGDC